MPTDEKVSFKKEILEDCASFVDMAQTLYHTLGDKGYVRKGSMHDIIRVTAYAAHLWFGMKGENRK